MMHPTTIGLLVSIDAFDDRERPASEKSDASDDEDGHFLERQLLNVHTHKIKIKNHRQVRET